MFTRQNGIVEAPGQDAQETARRVGYACAESLGSETCRRSDDARDLAGEGC
jgi:hypothetical protein